MALLGGGCRGETAAPSEPPKAAAPGSSTPAESQRPAHEVGGETVMTNDPPSPPPDPSPSAATPQPPASASPEPPGPPLAAADVVPHFQRWWKTWSSDHLTNPRKATLDARVAARGSVQQEACDVVAAHVEERAPVGSSELLFGDPALLHGRGDRCWWVHHDGMIGPGVGAALASDGKVLVVWVVSEG